MAQPAPLAREHSRVKQRRALGRWQPGEYIQKKESPVRGVTSSTHFARAANSAIYFLSFESFRRAISSAR
jgi:hypothetical protein